VHVIQQEVCTRWHTMDLTQVEQKYRTQQHRHSNNNNGEEDDGPDGKPAIVPLLSPLCQQGQLSESQNLPFFDVVSRSSRS
jgi:hypothetical protein